MSWRSFVRWAPMADDPPVLARRWPIVLIAVVVAAVLVAAVTFALTRPDHAVTASAPDPGPDQPPARPCVVFPKVDLSTTVAPEGTYLVSLSQDPPAPDSNLFNIYLDNGGAGFHIAAVPVALDVEVVGSEPVAWTEADEGSVQRVHDAVAFAVGQSATPAVTVRNGTIVAIDPIHTRWDMPERADDPCDELALVGGCELSEGDVRTDWPDGVDGALGSDIDSVAAKLTDALDRWNVDIEGATLSLTSAGCLFAAVVHGDLLLQMRMVRTVDGYFLHSVSTDVGDTVPLSYRISGSTATFPTPQVFGIWLPKATVSAQVTYGENTFGAATSVQSSRLDVTIEREPETVGSVLLKVVDADGRLRRLRVFQVPAGDTAAGS